MSDRNAIAFLVITLGLGLATLIVYLAVAHPLPWFIAIGMDVIWLAVVSCSLIRERVRARQASE
jgi:hypothetical protein